MAIVYSTQYQDAYVDVPSEKLAIGEANGRVRMIKFNHTFAAAVNAIGDIVKLCKIPKGAIVVGGRLHCASLGTTGIFKWGYAADAAAVEAADDDAFATVTDGDVGGQAVDITMKGAVGGFLKKFSAEVDCQLELTEASDGAAGDALKGYLLVVVE